MKLLTVKTSKFLLYTGLVVLMIGLLMFMWKDSFSINQQINSDKIAQFGDFIGGVTGSLWALAGVILFYVALTEQRKDFKTNKESLNAQTDALQQQIKEFELQREELSETRKVFKLQSKTLKKQQFESTFFNLLNLHHEIVNSIDLKVPQNYKRGASSSTEYETVTGRDCFVEFYRALKKTYHVNRKDLVSIDYKVLINSSYGGFFAVNQSDLGHYFRHLYHIFKFIDRSDELDKYMYTSIVRAQLSNDELCLLFYNCLSNYGKEKFLPLVEKYKLLKNIDKYSLAHLDHVALYKKTAFGE